jgi:hypothetical protein
MKVNSVGSHMIQKKIVFYDEGYSLHEIVKDAFENNSFSMEMSIFP